MPRKIQILTDLLFIFSSDTSSHGITKSGYAHHHRVETAPAHLSLCSSLKFQLEEQPFPAWVTWTPRGLASMGSWYSNPQDKIRSSCWPAPAPCIPIFLSVPSIPYIVNTCWGGREAYFILLLWKGHEGKEGFFVVLSLLLLLLLREGLFGVLFQYRQVLTCTCALRYSWK